MRIRCSESGPDREPGDGTPSREQIQVSPRLCAGPPARPGLPARLPVVVVARIGPIRPGLRGVCAAGGSMGDNRGCCFVMQADMLASSSRRIQEFLTAGGWGWWWWCWWGGGRGSNMDDRFDNTPPFVQNHRHVVIFTSALPFHCLIRSLWGLSRTKEGGWWWWWWGGAHKHAP